MIVPLEKSQEHKFLNNPTHSPTCCIIFVSSLYIDIYSLSMSYKAKRKKKGETVLVFILFYISSVL
jgi:hypothetical protein